MKMYITAKSMLICSKLSVTDIIITPTGTYANAEKNVIVRITSRFLFVMHSNAIIYVYVSAQTEKIIIMYNYTLSIKGHQVNHQN